MAREYSFTIRSHIKYGFCLFMVALLGLPKASLAQSFIEYLNKWHSVGENKTGAYSIRPVDSGDMLRGSVFPDKRGDYRWFMRVEYKNPTNDVAVRVIRSYMNCKKWSIDFDEILEYTSAGVLASIVGKKGGKRTPIAVAPQTPTEGALKRMCEQFRFE